MSLKKCLYVGALMGVSVLFGQEKVKDNFEQIALQKMQYATEKVHIEENVPRVLPQKTLTFKNNAKGAFVPENKIDTQEELEATLETYRKRYAPFMLDLAPQVKKTRERLNIGEFDFRPETQNDIDDFLYTLQGKGKWDLVEVPHYAGPEGRTTFWYRSKINLSKKMLSREQLFLGFKGVDYIAEVFLNGRFVGKHTGLFEAFEFELKKYAKEGENVLLVKVTNDYIQMGSNHQLTDRPIGNKIAACGGPGWNDPELGWHMCPVGSGLWQGVYIESRNAVAIQDVFVRPLPHENSAEIWLEIDSKYEATQNDYSIKWSLFGQNFKQVIAEDMEVSKIPAIMSDINYIKFKIHVSEKYLKWWSPETPWLYKIHVNLFKGGKLIDSQAKQFGMRTFTQETTGDLKGKFYLNGKEVKLRGANVMGNLKRSVVEKNFDQLRDDILIAKIANMNFWRFTQQPCQEEVYDYCDRLGIMTQTDLGLFAVLRKSMLQEALEQTTAMERLVRSHPSNIMVSFINEPTVKWTQQCMDREEINQFLSMAEQMVRIQNPDRVIKRVDGDYMNLSKGWMDHHCYNGWYGGGFTIGKLNRGYWHATPKNWMYGCGEYGAEGLDDVALMNEHYLERWLPKKGEAEKSWTPGVVYRVQTTDMHKNWFDTQESVNDWIAASHKHQEWVIDLTTRAFRRDLKMNSFAVHLLIDAWPAGWLKSIMNSERRAKPAFFAFKDALSPVLADLRTDKSSWFSGTEATIEAWVCNDTPDEIEKATIKYFFKVDGKIVMSGKSKAEVKASLPNFQGYVSFKIPEVKDRTEGFLYLGVFNKKGELLHDASLKMTLLPVLVKKTLQASVLGDNKKIEGLLDKLGYQFTRNKNIGTAELIVIADFNQFIAHKKEISDAVKNGARVVFFDVNIKDFSAFDTKKAAFNGHVSSNFISRKTGHNWVSDFEANDFKFWYNQGKDMATPFGFRSMKNKNDWELILKHNEAMVVGAKKVGQGSAVVCLFNLEDYCSENAMALKFAQIIFEKKV